MTTLFALNPTGAWFQWEPKFSEIAQLQATWVYHDHLGAILLHRSFHLQRDDGVVLSRVGAGYDETVSPNDLRSGVAHCGRANSLLQGHHRTGMAQPRAVIDVVGSEEGTKQFL